MGEVFQSLRLALELVLSADPDLAEIVLLSLGISTSAVLLAALVALPLGAALAVSRFPGQRVIVVLLNALMGLPPVVVGLVVYLLLSRSGPFGEWGLLFTPAAMVMAQTILVIPIICALSRQTVEDLWGEYSEQLRSLGAGRLAIVLTLLWEGRFSLLTAILAGFGRAVAEVGAVLMVGGNIAHYTRVMTTTIALETARGDLTLALALGIILISVVLVINAGAYLSREYAQRAGK
ncbi:MAG: ABC transporter permease [Gammaproteobacteria bacterium]|nr:ABC transporter permease [Gammaproteobacteria bacterium]